MQLTAKSICIDYYPIKNGNSKVLPDKFLRILSFKGQTQTKRIVSRETMNDDVNNRVNDYGYVVRDSEFRFPQYVSSTEVN